MGNAGADETEIADDGRGRDADHPAQIPLRGWSDILRRVYSEIIEDNVLLVAGGVTFYLLLALFPALTAFVSLYGLVADPATIARQVASLDGVLADDSLAILEDQLASLATQQGDALTFGLVLSLAIAFWTANSGTKAVIEAMNIAYQEREKRSFVRLNLVAFAFTLGGMLAAALMIIGVGAVPAALAFLNLGGLGDLVLRFARWPILLAVVAVGLALLYRYGPSRKQAEWRWISWGSALATLVWLAASVAFTLYLENFANYNATYGSLGALVGFLLWIWISMSIVIVGAELNAEMEHQTARDTTVGENRPMGRRGAYMADNVAGPPG